MKCFACGVDKDLNVKEVYPSSEDLICDSPIPPLMPIECQARKHLPDGSWGFRMAVVCFECFHRLSPDMWIGQDCWESLDPVTSFSDLPLPIGDAPQKWELMQYDPDRVKIEIE